MNILRTLVGALALVGLATTAVAAPIFTTPTGLTAGDQYRLAFVTSTTRDATSAVIADYNNFVNAAAIAVPDLLALGTTWKVIGSTATVNARDNTSTDPSSDGTGVAIYLLDGTTKIADNNTDLWDGSIDDFLNFSETGTTGAANIFTGTTLAGSAAGFGQALGGTSPLGIWTGRTTATNLAWVYHSKSPKTDHRHFYALSGILTVPSTGVPAPGALLLFGVALAGLALARRRAGKVA
jgi:hypothetical protein